MELKSNETRKILEPIEIQVMEVNKLRQLLTNTSVSTADETRVKSVFAEQLDAFAENLDKLSREEATDYQEMKTKITSTIEEFCSVKDIDKLILSINGLVVEDALQNMLNKFMLALKTLEDLKCLPLKQSLQDCVEYISEMGAVNEIEDFQNIKELGTSILEILGSLQLYMKDLVSHYLSEKIALYCYQLCTTFHMLVELVQEQHQLNAPVYGCKKYVCDRMCLCFQMILDVIAASNPQAEDETFEKENHFVYRMDLVLDIISNMANKSREEQIEECDELWLGIEDVFSHAMSIAQVCQPSNFKAITGACQSIMSEYENLKLQLHSETQDTALNNLFMNTLNDALYRLERKINISVLSLVMEVFSDPFSALRKLVMTCGNSLTAKKRSRSDLTKAIEDFDQLTDKAMQIGMFAVACCKDFNRIVRIRNCLAGFESLETELVSAIVAFYLHPDNKEMRANVKLLTAQWQLEMNKLHSTVDVIIDSAAYCQIILDELQERISVMSDRLDNRQRVTQCHVQVVVQRALSLSSQITATVKDIGNENIDKQTSMMICELKAAIFEAGAASKHLLAENATEPQQLRVIKRCELVLNVVKRLQPALHALMNKTASMAASHRKSGIGQGDMLSVNASLKFPTVVYDLPRDEKSVAYIKTPYTVKHYKSPLTIQPANSVPRSKSDLSSLIPYIKKGQTMRTEQSIMYKTPRRNDEAAECAPTRNSLNMRNLSNVRQHLFSRDSFASFSDIDLSRESIDLTNLLEKVANLTMNTSFASSASACENSRATPNGARTKSFSESIEISPSAALSNLNLSNLNVLTPAKTAGDECSAIGGGDAPSLTETPERLEDIQRLDERINALQRRMSSDASE